MILKTSDEKDIFSIRNILQHNGFQTSVQRPQFFQCIGIIRANWYNKKQQLRSINYGTAFALSSKIIATCTHNVYSQRFQKISTQIIFIPGIQNGMISQSQKRYKCSQLNQIKCNIPNKLFDFAPLKEELTLFVLDDGEEFICPSYIKIGQLQDECKDKQLQLVGYPSFSYRAVANLEQISLQREALSGKLHSLDKHIINHTMKTSVGQSGSPILTRNKKGEYVCVGIHTHRGLEYKYNSGIYFNDQILSQFYQFEYELKELYNNDLPQIVFVTSQKIVGPNTYFMRRPFIDYSFSIYDDQQQDQVYDLKRNYWDSSESILQNYLQSQIYNSQMLIKLQSDPIQSSDYEQKNYLYWQEATNTEKPNNLGNNISQNHQLTTISQRK